MTPWIEAIQRTLRLSGDSGVLVHVDHASPSRLGEIARTLLAEWPDLDVLDGVEGLETAPAGATRVLVPWLEEALWLNLNRPIVTRRRLKIVLWCDHATTVELSRKAPDFFDWISAHVECPKGLVPFALAGVRGALQAKAPGIHWTGGVDQAAKGKVLELLQACTPGTRLRWVDVEGPYPEVVARVNNESEPAAWVGSVLDAQWQVWRFRWACAEANTAALQLVLSRGLDCPGFWSVHDRMMALGEARKLLSSAGAGRAGLLAALLQLEPQAVGIAAQLLGAGVLEDQILLSIAAAEDPGVAVAGWAARTKGSRAARPGSPLGARAAGKARDQRHEGIDVETALRLGSEDVDWSHLANVADRLGDPSAAGSWRARARPHVVSGRRMASFPLPAYSYGVDSESESSELPTASPSIRPHARRPELRDELARQDHPRRARVLLRDNIHNNALAVLLEGAANGTATDRFAHLVTELAELYNIAGAPQIAVFLLTMVLGPVDPQLAVLFSADEAPEVFPFLDPDPSKKLRQILGTSFSARSALPDAATVSNAYRTLHDALHTQGRREEAAIVFSHWIKSKPRS